jgi:hypothetical protein
MPLVSFPEGLTEADLKSIGFSSALFIHRRTIAMPPFIAGRELSHRFYIEAVRPILDAHFAALPHAAAHIGSGGDVLGFDDELSPDHDWGPALTIFLRDEDARHADALAAVLREQLPHMFHSYPVDAIDAPDVQRIAARSLIGSIDQLSDSTDMRSDAAWRPLLRTLYTM